MGRYLGFGAAVLSALVWSCGSSESAGPGSSENGGTTGVAGAHSAGASSGGAASSTGGAGAGGGRASAGAAGSSAAAGGGAGYPPTFDDDRCVPSGPDVANVAGALTIYSAEFSGDLRTIAMGEDAVYWVERGEGIFRRAPGATTPELVVDISSTWGLFVIGSYLYSIDNGRRLMRASLEVLPATPELVLENVSERGLFHDDTNIYFTLSSGTGIHVLPIVEAVPGGTATAATLVPDMASAVMAVDSGQLFYTDNQAIFRIPLGGGAIDHVLTVAGAQHFTAADNMVYVAGGTDDAVLIKQSADGIGNGSDFEHLAFGNLRSPTSSTHQRLEALRVEGDRVYYREENGAIAWVKTDGSDCRILANLPESSSGDSLDWVMDAEYVYVIEADRTIYAIPK